MPFAAQAIIIQREQDAVCRKVEAPFERKVRQEKNRYLRSMIDHYRLTRHIEEAARQTDHNQCMVTIFKQFTSRAIRLTAKHVYPQRKSGINLETKALNELFDFWETTWMDYHGYAMAQNVTRTTVDDVRTALLNAVREQETNRDIIKRLRAVEEINALRAQTIARTETHNAAMFASSEVAKVIQAEDDSQLFKFWCSAEDERTRPTHLAMDSEIGIALEAKFMVGGVPMLRPGDPTAPAHEIINCRCVLAYGTLD